MRILLTLFLTCLSLASLASSKKYYAHKVQYRTFFGSCPSKAVGRLALTLMKEFEKDNSLLSVKKKIVNDKLKDKYFLSSYKVDYSPVKKMLKFHFDCPKPLLKVQIYKDNGDEFYTAILVENGELFDPTYEILLRSEKKITKDLPHLALPADKMNSNHHKEIASLINNLGPKFEKRISEIILSDKAELTIILSVGRKPSSAFLGKDFWEEKAIKLQKIVEYMSTKNSIPSVINLTNSKKAVVKFKE